MMKFGPAGLGGVKEAIDNLREFHKLGLRACEIAFTYGVYIKTEKEAKEIGEEAHKLGIELRIHAPYYINLNSSDKKKLEDSKNRILECCRIGNLLGASLVVFHPGFIGKMTREEAFENIKKAVLEIKEEIEKNKLKVKIAAETMGKINVFGSLEEILKLARETGIEYVVDFAHLYARSGGKMSYKEMLEKIPDKKINAHFSGIDYGEKGERNHKLTPETELRKLIEAIKEANKEVTLINESPDPVGDSIKALRIYEKL